MENVFFFKAFTFAICLLYTGFLAAIWTSKDALNTLLKVATAVVFLLGIPGLMGILKNGEFHYLMNLNIIYPGLIAGLFIFSRDSNTFAIIFKFISIVIIGSGIAYLSM
jgi:hypothetical protein